VQLSYLDRGLLFQQKSEILSVRSNSRNFGQQILELTVSLIKSLVMKSSSDALKIQSVPSAALLLSSRVVSVPVTLPGPRPHILQSSRPTSPHSSPLLAPGDWIVDIHRRSRPRSQGCHVSLRTLGTVG